MRGYLSGKLPFLTFIIFAAGVSLGIFIKCFYLFLFFAGLNLILGFLFLNKGEIVSADIFIFLLVFSLGALRVNSEPETFKDQKINEVSDLIIRVVSLPIESANKNSFTAKLISPSFGGKKIKLRVYDYSRQMKYLNLYQIRKAVLRKMDYKGYSYYALWIKKNSDIRFIESRGFWPMNRMISTRLISLFESNLSDLGYRFIGSVFLGRRELIKENKEAFADAGVAHLLAISGMHISLTAGFIFVFLGFFYIPFRAKLIVSWIVLFAYTLIIGFYPSTLRASLMFFFFSLMYFLKRKVSSLNCLGLAGFVLLLSEPLYLVNIGFQLSFLSVFSLVYVSRHLSFGKNKNFIHNYIKNIFISSVIVSIFIFPLISFYFGSVYLLSGFYKILLIPFFTLILSAHFVFIVLSFSPFLSSRLGNMVSFLSEQFITVVRFFSSLKFSI
ncbi:MAG: ComEC/Rec2 family competence protein, partial [Candidatus Omnitrophica bacterium]|nr:ComEC/Rec2 family competence protein [Candidatus Omnitrophota bacterium]